MQEEKPRDGLRPENNCAEIKSGIGILIAGLREANRLFEEGKDAGRKGVIAAVSAVIEFILPFQRMTRDNWLAPLTSLQSALLNLDDGEALPLLRPVRRPVGGRSLASAARESAKAMVAGTMHRLCETGLDTKEACEGVAKVCREAGFKPGRKGAKDSRGQEPEVTARTVRGWWEKIAEDVGRHSQAAQLFDHLKQSWSAKAQAVTQLIEIKGVEAVRNDLLEALRRSLVQMRASEH
jgi:hypothetical protein